MEIFNWLANHNVQLTFTQKGRKDVIIQLDVFKPNTVEEKYGGLIRREKTVVKNSNILDTIEELVEDIMKEL
jgi:hypothetical protein